MADQRLTDLSALAEAPATGDLFYLVDVSDTTDNAAGSSKKITYAYVASGILAEVGITASVAELNYVDGVTSAIQTQLNAKAPIASPTFTGTVTLPVGLTGVIRADSGVVSVDTDVTDLVIDAAADGATKGVAAFTATDFDAASGVVSLDYTNAQKASTTQAGFLTEIATAAETTTGTDATRAVSPDGLAGSDYGKRVVGVLVFDDATEVSTGDGAGDVFFRIPSTMNGWNLVAVAASNQTAATGTGSETTDIMIYNVTQTADMLSVALTIDEDETDSSTADASYTIDTNNDDVATGDQLRIDVDAVPSTTGGNGLYVELIFQLP
jgi:hypothetical protein